MSNLINEWYVNCINTSEILAIINPNSNPAKRRIKEAKDNNLLIDITEGNKTCSTIIMKTGHVVISSNKPETLKIRFNE